MIENKNRKKIYYTLLVLMLIIFAILILPNLIINITNDITQTSIQKLQTTGGTTIDTVNSNPYVKSDGKPYLEITSYALTSKGQIYGIASYPGRVLYCVEHGTAFSRYAGTLRLFQVYPKYGDIYRPGMWIPQRIMKCYEGHGEETYNYQRTYPVLWCVNNHFNLAMSGSKYLPDAAYILTYPAINSVTQEKQDALYNTALNTGAKEKPNSIYYEAVHYKDFHDQTTDMGKNYQQPDIKVKNETDPSEVTIKANNIEKTLVVGPFSIDYIYGYYEENNIAFGGISDMYMVGYNSKGDIVKERIEITNYIDNNGKVYTLNKSDYFVPNEQDKSFVDRTKQVYPKGKSAGEEYFQVIIDNPNAGLSDNGNGDQYVSNLKLHIEFKWMGVTSANVCRKEGKVYEVAWMHVPINYHSHDDGSYDYDCRELSTLNAINVQDHIELLEGIRKLFKTELEIDAGDDKGFPITMNLGGKVWEDVPAGKENTADGKYGDNDRVIPNVKVTLYTESGNVATLLSDPSEGEVMSRINPTYTDENGDYLFKGLDPLKKYYVTFEYNGQIYLPTDYGADVSQYNTANWEITSKGTETPGDRDAYNSQFAEIGSAPLNYKSSNNLNTGALVNGYNEAFSQYELMGFEMTENGNYTNTLRLIDSFYKIEGGNIVETNELQEGEISKAIKEFISANKKSPTEEDMKTIYSKIAGGDQETWRKLQFIEDCKIESYTQAQGASHDLYPVYDTFVINSTIDTKYETAEEARQCTFDTKEVVINGVTYKPIYPGQFYINQGLWRRQETDLALRKDIVYAATRINGKTEVYTYDKRTQTADYWEIQLRMRDYNNYYAGNYTRELYPADYTYRSASTNQSGADLELYVTYKITVRNSSTSIVSQITEIVDYYDKDYTYMDNLSWVMYGSNSEISLSANDYYNTIDQLSLQGNLAQNAKATNANDNSRYGTASQQSGMEAEYNSVYIRGLDGKKLASGEEAYIYLTFKVNENSEGIILDDGTHGNDSTLKQNYAEINGYTTYYRDGTKLPNNQTKSSSDPAGIIDVDSNPGNLCLDDLKGDKYEKNFEDDTDRAKSIKVTLDDTAIRSINGTVWEDERTQSVSGSVIGDGVRQDGEIGINGVTVELVERLENGNEYVWQTTKTGANGYYEFKTDESGNVYIIPGNYIIRFQYGNNEDTVIPNYNNNGNETSYNGQDFKSTVYQKDMNGKEITEYTGTKIEGYTGEYYDIQQLDDFGSNISDAKDIWSMREAVNNYSSNNGNGVSNNLAEVLASPYADTIDSALIKELIDNTKMTAETGLIVFEGEYNRILSPDDDSSNGKYTLNSVDFGLTERPKAQLELSKKVTNVKVTLANGSIQFDATKSATDITWTPGTEYNLSSKMSKNKYEEYYNDNHRYAYREEVGKLVSGKYNGSEVNGNGLINVTMDEELMHGATITISYKLAVTNVGETDYTGQDFYYKGTGATETVTTSADVVLDYVANNLQYRVADNESGTWSIVDDAVNTAKLNTGLEEAVSKYNTILKTEALKDELKPGESKTVQLVLTQLMTSQNTSDDRSYTNIAEITTISNSVGRRMAYSIQGNQDPTAMPAEVDSVKAEKVVVLPPFGIGNIVVYITLSIAVLAILTGGIIFIKKRVLKK